VSQKALSRNFIFVSVVTDHVFDPLPGLEHVDPVLFHGHVEPVPVLFVPTSDLPFAYIVANAPGFHQELAVDEQLVQEQIPIQPDELAQEAHMIGNLYYYIYPIDMDVLRLHIRIQDTLKPSQIHIHKRLFVVTFSLVFVLLICF
jgi:hypothetical protein